MKQQLIKKEYWIEKIQPKILKDGDIPSIMPRIGQSELSTHFMLTFESEIDATFFMLKWS